MPEQTTPSRSIVNKLDLFAITFAFLFLLSGLFTLSNYGMSWDEGLGNFFFGNRYAQYITTFDATYLDFATVLPEEQPGMLQLEQYAPFRDRAHEFPAVVDMLSASFMRVFAYELNMADPVDAFHSFTILLAALYLLTQYYYVTVLFDRLTALVSVLLLGTFPRFWGDMHFNPKDVPEAIFFALTILSFANWVKKPSWGRALVPGFFFGLAIGVKANALFIPVVLAAWLLLWLVSPRQGFADLVALAKKFKHILGLGVAAVLTYWASWPLLYNSPGMAKLYFLYIFSQGGRQGKGEWSLQPLRMLVSSSPEIFLAALALGLLAALGLILFRKQEQRLAILLLLWLAIPIARISMPMSVNFDGIRHFLEFLPAATILGGLGVSQVSLWLRKKNAVLYSGFVTFLVTAFVVNIAVINLLYHPYQYIYFNSLVGGSRGAEKVFKQGEVTDYWAVSYRDGIRWLNRVAPQDAMLDVPIGDYLVNIPAANWLRKDITLISDAQVDEFRGSGRTIYVMHITRPAFYKAVAESCLGVKPVYQKKVDGVSVMQIHLLSDCK